MNKSKLKQVSPAARTAGSQQRMVRDQQQQLTKDLHELVDRIMVYATEPEAWPLTHQEQVTFVREMAYMAMKIRKSEAYLAETLKMSVEELAMSS